MQPHYAERSAISQFSSISSTTLWTWTKFKPQDNGDAVLRNRVYALKWVAQFQHSAWRGRRFRPTHYPVPISSLETAPAATALSFCSTHDGFLKVHFTFINNQKPFRTKTYSHWYSFGSKMRYHYKILPLFACLINRLTESIYRDYLKGFHSRLNV